MKTKSYLSQFIKITLLIFFVLNNIGCSESGTSTTPEAGTSIPESNLSNVPESVKASSTFGTAKFGTSTFK